MTGLDRSSDVADTSAARRRIIVALGVVVSAFLLVVVLRRVDLEAAWETARGANPLLLVAGVVVVNAALIPQAIRWRLFTRTVVRNVPGPVGFLGVILAAQAINSVIPARAGDVMRVAWLRRRSGIAISAAAASMLADRILDVVLLTAILGVGIWFVDAPHWVVTVSIVAGIACCAFFVLWAAARRHLRRRDPVESPDASAGLVRRVIGALGRFVRSFAGILDGTQMIRGVALTAASWLIWSVGALAVAHSVDVEITLLQTLFVGALLNVGLAIPSSPGFVGTYQWLIIEALAIFGVGASAGFAYALILQAAWLIPQTIVGFVILPRLGVSRTPSSTDDRTT